MDDHDYDDFLTEGMTATTATVSERHRRLDTGELEPPNLILALLSQHIREGRPITFMGTCLMKDIVNGLYQKRMHSSRNWTAFEIDLLRYLLTREYRHLRTVVHELRDDVADLFCTILKPVPDPVPAGDPNNVVEQRAAFILRTKRHENLRFYENPMFLWHAPDQGRRRRRPGYWFWTRPMESKDFEQIADEAGWLGRPEYRTQWVMQAETNQGRLLNLIIVAFYANIPQVDCPAFFELSQALDLAEIGPPSTTHQRQ